MTSGHLLVACVLAGSLLGGCGSSPKPGSEGDPCKKDTDCAGTLMCIGGVCRYHDCSDRSCPKGWICLSGSCTEPSCQGVSCDPDQACAGGKCYPVDCSSRPCPGLGMVCIQDQCIAQGCAGVQCPAGQECAGGLCYPKDCGATPCNDFAEVCLDGQCVQKSCVGVRCPAPQVCANGLCYPASCAQPCGSDEVCQDGVCVERSCAQVTCPVGQVCVNGKCFPKDCGMVVCAADEVCQNGHCVKKGCTDGRCCPDQACQASNICQQVTCPSGTFWCSLAGGIPAWTLQVGQCDDGDPCTLGDTCQDSAKCAGAPVTCNQPPATACIDANTLRTYSSPGTCQGGQCQYPHQDTACSFGCQAAACNPCQPQCGSRRCGPDPLCQQSCGICGSGYGCTSAGGCVSVGMSWRTINAGSFVMGTPADEPGRDNFNGIPAGSLDETQHSVTLTHSFSMATTEVTQQQFLSAMGYNPSMFSNCGGNCPVEMVSWHEAAAFCNALSLGEGFTPCFTCSGSGANVNCLLSTALSDPYHCPGYRHPSEAEWEYAARAGTPWAFWNGGITNLECSPVDLNLSAIGWYRGNSQATYNGVLPIDCNGTQINIGTHPVASKSANPWGLDDVSGNVWEWVLECTYNYPAGPQSDPLGPLTCASESDRIFRGGSFGQLAYFCRCGERANVPCYTDHCADIGFRPVRTLNP